MSIADQVTRIQTRKISHLSSSILTRVCAVEKKLDDTADRLWDLEEHLMGERLSDGEVYVRRRVR